MGQFTITDRRPGLTTAGLSQQALPAAAADPRRPVPHPPSARGAHARASRLTLSFNF